MCGRARHNEGVSYGSPKFWSFSLHIFFWVSQNITVKVRVDCSVRRNKFTVNSPLHVERNNEHAPCWTPDLLHLFCSWWLWALPLWRLLLCYWIITVNQLMSLIMILEIKLGFSLAFSHNSRRMFTCCCFWSFVKSWRTNFAAVWRMFKLFVKISW
jgi:hypothetical protein